MSIAEALQFARSLKPYDYLPYYLTMVRLSSIFYPHVPAAFTEANGEYP